MSNFEKEKKAFDSYLDTIDSDIEYREYLIMDSAFHSGYTCRDTEFKKLFEALLDAISFIQKEGERLEYQWDDENAANRFYLKSNGYKNVIKALQNKEEKNET